MGTSQCNGTRAHKEGKVGKSRPDDDQAERTYRGTNHGSKADAMDFACAIPNCSQSHQERVLSSSNNIRHDDNLGCGATSLDGGQEKVEPKEVLRCSCSGLEMG